MRKKAVLPTMAVLVLSIGSFAGGVAAQEADGPGEGAKARKTASGTVSVETDADGRDRYYIEMADGSIVELSFGPSWFWGPLSPLAGLVGSTVEIGGNAQRTPNENASDPAAPRKDPTFKAKTVGGERIKAKGKPPWAGGPKTVGAVHPGSAGWSRGQANKAEKAAAKSEDKAAKAAAKSRG